MQGSSGAQVELGLIPSAHSKSRVQTPESTLQSQMKASLERSRQCQFGPHPFGSPPIGRLPPEETRSAGCVGISISLVAGKSPELLLRDLIEKARQTISSLLS